VKVINLVHEVNMYKVEEPATMTTDIDIQEKEKDLSSCNAYPKRLLIMSSEESWHTMLGLDLRVMEWSSWSMMRRDCREAWWVQQ
jgi:hypothetical protein